jgi:hypothetical protein
MPPIIAHFTIIAVLVAHHAVCSSSTISLWRTSPMVNKQNTSEKKNKEVNGRGEEQREITEEETISALIYMYILSIDLSRSCMNQIEFQNSPSRYDNRLV